MDMVNFFGMLRYAFTLVNPVITAACVILLLVLLVLAVLHHKWRDDDRMLSRWRVFALLPLVLGAAHFFLFVFPHVHAKLGLYIWVYLIAFGGFFPMLLAKRRFGYRYFAALTAICATGIFAIYIFLSPMIPRVAFLFDKSYTETFKGIVTELDRNYILKEWKGVDLSALETKYLPRIEKAEQEQNQMEFIDALEDFGAELHDGHIWVSYSHEVDESQSGYKEHEYGLGLILLDSGEVIAVCTTEEVNQLGIGDGTVITKWNGKPVKQAAQEDVRDQGCPVQENEDILRVSDLAAVGGDTVEVAFRDKSGREQTAVLKDLGEMHTQQEMAAAFAHESGEDGNDENYSTKMLNDTCGYLRVNSENTDTIHDLAGFWSGNHKFAREMFRKKLRDLKSQGMETLVIDLRANGGGFHEVGIALAELLTDQDFCGYGLGIRRNGQYHCVAEHGIHGDGEFADLKVVALTNFWCESAGDGTALYLSRLPNVTLAGITNPCGCGQLTGGDINCGFVSFSYPIGLCLNESGEPNIDTGADRISRNPVEEKIPLDKDAAMQIFCDKEDYELSWALDYLGRQ